MIIATPFIRTRPILHSLAWQERARRLSRPSNPTLNTVDQALQAARAYSEEIRHDAVSRRIYRSFAALATDQFEALLAFSIWKVRSRSFSSL